jgi:hypothetical protein
MSNYLDVFYDYLKINCPGFISMTIAEIKTGKIFYSESEDPNFDAELAITFNIEIVKSKLNLINALDLKNQKISAIMTKLSSQIHIIDVTDDAEYIIYLAVDSTNGRLGLYNSILKKYKNEIASRVNI